MNIDKNMLILDGGMISFPHNIDCILQVQDVLLVLLDIFPSDDNSINNVYGVRNGKIIWQVEDFRNYIKDCPISFSYTLMRESDNNKVLLTDFNGYKIAIDPYTGKIIPSNGSNQVEED